MFYILPHAHHLKPFCHLVSCRIKAFPSFISLYLSGVSVLNPTPAKDLISSLHLPLCLSALTSTISGLPLCQFWLYSVIISTYDTTCTDPIRVLHHLCIILKFYPLPARFTSPPHDTPNVFFSLYHFRLILVFLYFFFFFIICFFHLNYSRFISLPISICRVFFSGMTDQKRNFGGAASRGRGGEGRGVVGGRGTATEFMAVTVRSKRWLHLFSPPRNGQLISCNPIMLSSSFGFALYITSLLFTISSVLLCSIL